MAILDRADDRIREFTTFSDGTDRAELARALNLPAPTVVSAVRRLLASGELVETDQARLRPAAGRPARLLRIAGPATLVGLISWDGDRLRAGCLDTTGRTVAERTLDPPDRRAGTEGLARVVERLLALAKRQSGYRLRSVVFSVPAPFLSGHGAPREHALLDPAAVPFPVTASGDLEAALSDRFGVPVVMENDANLAALGELYADGARKVENAVYLKVNGVGFGSAIVVNGALARGARGYAGELAHLQVDEDGPLCACGGRGCLQYRVRDRLVSSAQWAYEEPITFADLPRLAEAGDAGAIRMMRDIGRTLGGPLAHLCTFLDPELLLVGGTLGPSAEHVVAGIRDVLAVQAPPVIADNLTVAISELGPAAEATGAVEAARLAARR
jgi:predicted NBD/HSP70 family sugar kinase